MAKPTELPIFNTNDTNSTAPTSIRQTDGWQTVGGVPEKPSYQNFNYLQNRNWKWFKYFDEREQTLTHNVTSDGDYTLTSDENSFGRIVITDTSVLLTATRSIILDDNQRSVIVQNNTLQTITFKTVAGTGVSINVGDFNTIYNDGTNVISNSTSLDIATSAEIIAGTDNTKAITPLGYNQTALGWGQIWQNLTASRASDVLYTNTSGRPIFVTATVSPTSGFQNYMEIDGIKTSVFYNANGDDNVFLSAVIPNNSTYKLIANSRPLINWAELR